MWTQIGISPHVGLGAASAGGVCGLFSRRDLRAMRNIAERNHVIAEGADACAIAAGLSGNCGSGKVVCVASAGNIDVTKFSELVSSKAD